MIAAVKGAGPLPVVDGLDLPAPYRDALRPGELVPGSEGRRRLPRYFYEIESWEIALETRLSPHFGAYELLDVDVREAEPLRGFPRYLPCAVVLLAAALEQLRAAVGDTVRIAANGGYRSPSHAGSRPGSPHCWGTAADVYRIGDEYLDSEERIERYRTVAQSLPGAWVRPYAEEPGGAFDHVHLDWGFGTLVPRDAGDWRPPSGSP